MRREAHIMPSLPNHLTLDAKLTIEAARTRGKLPKLSIDAYNGGVMRPSGFWGDVIVDLSGIRKPPGPTPILKDHDHSQIVGHADVKITDRIRAEGVVSGTGPAAEEVVGAAKNGFPWKASIGIAVEKTLYLDDDEQAEVNGTIVDGPIAVVRQAMLGEISLLPWPADETTTVDVAARKQATEGGAGMPIETKPEKTAEQIRTEAAAETKRIADIRELCAGDHADIEAQAIRDGWDVAKTELAVLRAERQSAPAIQSRRGPNVSDTDVMAAGMLCAAGMGETAEKQISAAAAEQGHEMRHWHLLDFARAAVQAAGRFQTNWSKDELLQAAFSTTSFPTALGSAANKSVAMAYQNTPSAWRDVCDIARATDFKDHTRVRLSSFDNLSQVGPAGEIKHVTEASELTYTFSVDTFARMISITRQALINDDAGLLEGIGPALGRSAARSVNDLFASTLLANAGSFFAAGNNNYFSGASTNLQSSSLATAFKMLREMVDANSHPIDVTPRTLLVPAALEVTARELVTSGEIQRISTSDSKLPTGNIWKNYLALAVEPRLGMSAYTGYSTTAWYLFSDRSNAAMIAAFLEGRRAPTIEFEEVAFDKLGIQGRCYLDYGFRLSDSNAAIKSKGSA